MHQPGEVKMEMAKENLAARTILRRNPKTYLESTRFLSTPLQILIDFQLLTDSLAFLLKAIFLCTCCCRICGSYEAMGLGRISEALQDFTGGVIEMINLKTPPRDIYKVLQKAHDRHSLMGASIEV